MSRNVFVFGANRSGKHGRGAALFARQHHGAIYGQGEGLQGDSYGIPTKGFTLKVLPLSEINMHVYTFLEFARSHPDTTFNMTRIGCGLAGYKDNQIAPMFSDAPKNVILPTEWIPYV